MCAKPMQIRFDEIDRFVINYDGIRYLVLFDYKRYDENYNRITHLISEKVVLKIVFIIILQESELIHIILYL